MCGPVKWEAECVMGSTHREMHGKHLAKHLPVKAGICETHGKYECGEMV